MKESLARAVVKEDDVGKLTVPRRATVRLGERGIEKIMPRVQDDVGIKALRLTRSRFLETPRLQIRRLRVEINKFRRRVRLDERPQSIKIVDAFRRLKSVFVKNLRRVDA